MDLIMATIMYFGGQYGSNSKMVYICVTKWRCLKSAQNKIPPFSWRSRFLVTSKMTLMTFQKLNPMISCFLHLLADDINTKIDQSNRMQCVKYIKYTMCPSNTIFDLIAAAILDLWGSIKVKLKFWPQKWNPWLQKWYTPCVIQWCWMKNAPN